MRNRKNKNTAVRESSITRGSCYFQTELEVNEGVRLWRREVLFSLRPSPQCVNQNSVHVASWTANDLGDLQQTSTTWLENNQEDPGVFTDEERCRLQIGYVHTFWDRWDLKEKVPTGKVSGIFPIPTSDSKRGVV